MHKKLAEAALFMATKPLGLDELGKILGVNSLGFVKEVMEELQKEYEDRGMDLVNTQDGWMLQVKQELLPKVAHLTPYHDMSEGTKRSLALIVYKEPIKQSQLIKTQGNKAYAYVKDLHKKGLIKAEKDGRTKTLYLTPEFERYFGEERKKIRERMDIQVQSDIQEKKSQESKHVQEMPKQIKTQVQKTLDMSIVQEPEEELPEPDVPKPEQQEPEPPKKESKKIKEIKKKQNGEKKPVVETGEIKFDDLKKKK